MTLRQSSSGPQQARSRETHEALIAAAEIEFAKKGIAQATVQEICDRAGVAVGTFYGRFADKDALLLAWYERFFERGRARLLAAFADNVWQGKSAAQILHGLVADRVRHYRRHKSLLKALLLYIRARSAPEFKPFATRMRVPVLQRLMELLKARPGEWSHAQPELAVRMTVILMESSVQNVVLFSENRGKELLVADDVLVREISAALCAYLRVTT